MLQSIGLSKKQLIKMLCYEGLMYSAFATLVTLVLGTGLGFLSVQIVVKTINPYFYYSFPWLIVLIYLGRWNNRMGSAGRRYAAPLFLGFSKKF